MLNAHDYSLFAIWNDRQITRERFLSDVLQLSKRLPDKRFGINLCEDRYLFCVTFLALLVRDQINLLPHNQTKNTVENLLVDYDSAYCLTDQADTHKFSDTYIVAQVFDNEKVTGCLQVHKDQIAAIAFTSGSTDKPKPSVKKWKTFLDMAQLALRQFNWPHHKSIVISTVPAQHMYGLETSLFWPLGSDMAIHHTRPFFPEDIRRVTMGMTRKCVLISTPAHLKSCVSMNLNWQNITAILSSTAPLDRALALTVENHFQAPCYEIFGSTETLSYASRRVTCDERWKPYSGVSLSSRNDVTYLSMPDDHSEMMLDDVFDVHNNGDFSVLGRKSDLVKVAGKRSSLTYLNLKLNSIPGVDDGLFFVPDNIDEFRRVGALAVTSLSIQKILDELRERIDEIFLPRPLIFVDHIPRNAVGKVIRSELEKLISSNRESKK